MSDRTPVTEGWGVGPMGHISHFLRDGHPVCQTVEYESWRAASSASHQCPQCASVTEQD